jgi:hypothetical protein
MLYVTIPATEYFDHSRNEFVDVGEHKLQLEHSLVSISKWEAKWEKPFISKDPKTTEETFDYIRCMTLTQNVNPNVYRVIPNDVLEQIDAYINAPMTATKFNNDLKTKAQKEIITSDLIYYWMIVENIPFECQKWHLNKLLTLIRVCSIKNTPPKKMSKKDILARNRTLNAQRKEALKTKG